MSNQNEIEMFVEKTRYYFDGDNIIHIIPTSAADEKVAIKNKEAFLRLLENIEGKVNIFIDLNNVGKSSSEARKVWNELQEHKKIGKVAFFGIHPVARVIASFSMGLSRKEDMRFFKTKEEALAWLKEGE